MENVLLLDAHLAHLTQRKATALVLAVSQALKVLSQSWENEDH